MDKIILGNTGLTVSRLCFGGIPFGGTGWRRDPSMEPKDAGKVLKRAFELEINFWDTAEGYKSHPPIGQGLPKDVLSLAL
jgi:aryl-alcohol dehydrogenase-like predicted oxidoreductase